MELIDFDKIDKWEEDMMTFQFVSSMVWFYNLQPNLFGFAKRFL